MKRADLTQALGRGTANTLAVLLSKLSPRTARKLRQTVRWSKRFRPETDRYVSRGGGRVGTAVGDDLGGGAARDVFHPSEEFLRRAKFVQTKADEAQDTLKRLGVGTALTGVTALPAATYLGVKSMQDKSAAYRLGHELGVKQAFKGMAVWDGLRRLLGWTGKAITNRLPAGTSNYLNQSVGEAANRLSQQAGHIARTGAQRIGLMESPQIKALREAQKSRLGR